MTSVSARMICDVKESVIWYYLNKKDVLEFENSPNYDLIFKFFDF